jgi:Enoyl-CoA hydratase/isomerase
LTDGEVSQWVRNVVLAVLAGARIPPDCDRSSDLSAGRFVPQAAVRSAANGYPKPSTAGFSIVLANPPFNRIDSAFATNLLDAVHRASESAIRVQVVRAEGQYFSFGGEVREWPGKDVNWFRTFVAEVNQSHRAIEAFRVPTLASVQGIAMGGGFELALACDLIVAAEDAAFRNVEVTTGMLPIAWGNGGVAAADAVMLDITMDLFDSADARKGFAVSAKAFDENIEPPPLTFDGR